jgi:hypothetical protein
MTADLDLAIRLACAELVLREARKRGLRIGTDGDEIVLYAPLATPRPIIFWFERWLGELRVECIQIIQHGLFAAERVS